MKWNLLLRGNGRMRVIMKKIYETAIILFGTLGWWGFVYPDLCLTGDVYEQEADGQEEETEISDGIDETKAECEMDLQKLVPELKEAGNRQSEGGENTPEEGWQVGRVRIKSRIMEYVYQVKKK